ncbi:blue-light photoreceptor PHR2 [Mercurialis annua]|uniref:blue-light photoreceptor PHR2 n=1 Tax=Mercurialis annua TaxID=3986 RepID=UPI00215EB679|nr:blue-light photoreceptor PHR2 [Mercurialis annua]
MDSTHQTQETNPEEEQQIHTIVPSQSQSPFASASLSLSLPTILPTHFFTQPKISFLFSPTKAKIPTQASSLSHLSLTSQTLHHPRLSFNSTVSANPLHRTLSLTPRRPSDPSNAAAIRRASIVWLRNDLRVHDNESLNSANNESMSVLPVYCFDPREYGKSSSGFDKTGPYRASFLIESVADLRKNLQARGSDLVVRVGRPETVLVELAKAVGADAVYAHREVSHDEVKAEEKIDGALKDEGIEVKYFWGSTLYHMDDLPFELEDMPSNYGGFREKVQGLEIRKTIAALDQLKGKPSRGDVEPGEIPSLLDLGLNPPQDGKPAATASMVGGETEALQRLRKFAAECQAQPPKSGSQDSIYGANFSCKISPWLTMGCISPRSMFDELKKTASRTVSATSKGSGGGSSADSGMNWLMFELLWRDFFRFITKKYSSPKKQLEVTPATACTGAFA